MNIPRPTLKCVRRRGLWLQVFQLPNRRRQSVSLIIRPPIKPNRYDVVEHSIRVASAQCQSQLRVKMRRTRLEHIQSVLPR